MQGLGLAIAWIEPKRSQKQILEGSFAVGLVSACTSICPIHLPFNNSKIEGRAAQVQIPTACCDCPVWHVAPKSKVCHICSFIYRQFGSKSFKIMLSEDQKNPKVRSRKQVALITGTNPDLSDIVDEKDQKGRYEIWVPNCSLSKKQSSYHQFRTSLLICHFPRLRKKKCLTTMDPYLRYDIHCDALCPTRNRPLAVGS